MLDEDECGIEDGGGGVGLVDGPATAFVCSLFMPHKGRLGLVGRLHTIALTESCCPLFMHSLILPILRLPVTKSIRSGVPPDQEPSGARFARL